MSIFSGVWLLAAVACSCTLGLGRAKTTTYTRLPQIDRVSHYEPLSYDTRPLIDKHDRIARGIIYEPQIKNLQLQFSAYGRTFHLKLQPSRSAFSSAPQFRVNGNPSNSYDPATFYEGEILGDPASHVTGHVIDGVFSGVIRSSEGTYHVEKSKKFFLDHEDISFHSLIYHEKDVEFPQQQSGCGVNGLAWQQMRDLQASAVPLGTPSSSKRAKTMSDLFKRSQGKRALTSTGGNFCHMRVAVDHLFYADIGGSDDRNTFAEVVMTFNLVQEIFRRTDFDGDGTQDFITPSIEVFEILTQSDPDYLFGAATINITVTDFLFLWSQLHHEVFCLALLLTSRDFDDGAMGLAWIAQPPGGGHAGVCEGRVQLSIGERSLNTAVVTFTDFGRQQPRAVSVVNVAHQLGHNFGSRHDPTSGPCASGSNGGGNYIMFNPWATNGQQTNNNLFSPCSIRDIREVLESNKSDCFSNEASFCGNGILEENEECDQDPCCDNYTCTLLPGVECSSQELCCNSSCQFIRSNDVCRISTECAEEARCNSVSGACPPSTPRASGNLCNNGSNVCDANGNCVGSYCLQFPGLSECQCTAADGYPQERFCDVCCLYQGTCQSTFDLAGNPALPGLEFRTLEPGRSCNNFEGYCSQQDSGGMGRCIVVNNDLDIPSEETPTMNSGEPPMMPSLHHTHHIILYYIITSYFVTS